MSAVIPNYRQVGCGCCTGREATEQADWGTYTVRVDQCVCWIHQDTPRGRPPHKCTAHGPRPGVTIWDAPA